jgi:phosphoribosylformimino-5-aminoimidazole carboxamide ribotide isomerase
LHLVDLDGARDGTPGNHDLIRQMAGQSRIRIQLGGGLRNRQVVDTAFGNGVSRAVIGSAAVEQPRLLRELLDAYGPERICLAIDVRVDGTGIPRVRTRGWVQEHQLSLWELLESFGDTLLRHVLCTDIERDGALAGPGFDLYEQAQQRFPAIAWQASGGIRSAADLARLSRMGLAAAISGKALLEGRIQLEELQPYLHDA